MSSREAELRLAARWIERGASAYAAYAAERLLSSSPATAGRFGPGAFGDWKDHLTVRLGAMAAALAVGEPSLFVSEVSWSRVSFESRQVPVADLRSSLDALRGVLVDELPPAAGKAAAEVLDRALAALDGDAAPVAPVLDPGKETHRLASAYIEAVLGGDRRAAIRLLTEATDGGLSVERAYCEVLMPVQREMGRRWHHNELGVAQEHLVSETTYEAMAVLCERAERAAPYGKLAMTAGVEGNAHGLAVRVVADLLEIAGFGVVNLGTDLPTRELVWAVGDFEPDLLALSATLPTHVPAAAMAVRAVRELEHEVKILVGGRVFETTPGLWRRVGADASAATAADAVESARELLGLAGGTAS